MKYYPHTHVHGMGESWDPADIAKAKKIVPTGGLILLPRNSQSQLCLKVPKLWKRVMIYVFEFFFLSTTILALKVTVLQKKSKTLYSYGMVEIIEVVKYFFLIEKWFFGFVKIQKVI